MAASSHGVSAGVAASTQPSSVGVAVSVGGLDGESVTPWAPCVCDVVDKLFFFFCFGYLPKEAGMAED